MTLLISETTFQKLEQIQLNEELKQSEERYRNVIDISPDAIIIHCEGKIVLANNAAVQLVGASGPDDLLGKSAIDIIHPDDRKMALTLIMNLLKDGEPAPLHEQRMIKMDGSVIFAEVAAVRTHFNGKPASLVVLRDITERKLAQEQQQRMAQMLDLAPNSIIIHDFDGNIFFANKKTLEFHGYTNEEFSNFSLGDLITHESLKHMPEKMNLIKKEGHSSFQVQHFRKDGTILPLEVSAATTKWDDKNAVISIGSDITERRNQEKALQQSEEKFKNIFRNSVVGISITDLAGNLSVNKAFSQIVGYSEEELNNSNWRKFTHPEDIDKNKDILDSIIAGEIKTARWEKRYIHKNGNIVWVDISTTLQRDNNGKPQYFITTIIDITAKKLAEENLFSSKQILEGIFNTLPVRIFWKDKDLNYLGCNKAFADDAGFSNPKDIIGKNDSQLVWHDQADIYNADDIQVIKSGIPKLNIEEPQTTPTGEKNTLLTNKIPLLDNNNQVRGVLGTYMDITEQKIAEIKLQESYNLLNNLTSMVPGVVYQYRLYPDGRSAFPISSPGMNDIYEVTPDEVKEDASLVFTRIHPDDYDSIVETINESAEKLTLYHSEFRVILPKQGLRWRVCDAKPERLEDGSTLWYGIISDITERKNAEKEIIKAKEKAEESDRLKSAFLANMSHEIRTPMNGILGFTSLLQEPALTGEQQQEYIEIIQKSGNRMLNTINDIIDISKIEAGQMSVSVSEVNITEELSNIYSFFRPEAHRKGLDFILKNELSGNETLIYSDQEKLQSVLTNLVKNAIKFCDEGSINFGCSKKGNELEFYVKDTGIGIPKHRQKAVFERFIQADIDDRNAHQGSGLGLTISKAYVEMMGGKIWMDSKAGQGTAFYFTIPCKPITKEKTDLAQKLNSNTPFNKMSKLKILLVDDDQVSGMLINEMLSDLCQKLHIVTNGMEALEFCKNNPDIDVILMDIRMPVMEGYEATRKIREFNKKVVIIAQTAFALSGDHEKAIEAGCNEHISKPVMRDNLLLLLQKYFN
ncbi:MAG TPA: PAS domain S-box protein [Draconibacterium sp.]|nr:PAS domain S-box protein [Draconibacterium sp.]